MLLPSGQECVVARSATKPGGLGACPHSRKRNEGRALICGTDHGTQNRTFGRSKGSINIIAGDVLVFVGGLGEAGQLGGELPRRVKRVAVLHRGEGDDGGSAMPAAPV